MSEFGLCFISVHFETTCLGQETSVSLYETCIGFNAKCWLGGMKHFSSTWGEIFPTSQGKRS